jgi:hypothetical protein
MARDDFDVGPLLVSRKRVPVLEKAFHDLLLDLALNRGNPLELRSNGSSIRFRAGQEAAERLAFADHGALQVFDP